MTGKWTPERKREYARERYRDLKTVNYKKTKKKNKAPEPDSTSKDVRSEFSVNQFQDFWMDNAVENLFSLISVIADANPNVVACNLAPDRLSVKITDKQGFLQGMQRLIESKRDSVLFSETSGGKKPKKNVKLGYILPQYGARVKGKNVVKEKMYDDREMLKRLSEGFFPKPGRKICVLCSSNFEKSTDYLKQSILPSVTKNAALSGTLSKDEYFRNLCPTCYMLGALEWTDDRIMYRNQPDGISVALYPMSTDLSLLNKEKKIGLARLSTRTLTSNLTTRTEDGNDLSVHGPYSALLLFLERILQSIERDVGDLFSEASTFHYPFRTWACLKVPSGNIKNVKIETIELPGNIVSVVREAHDPLSGGEALKVYSYLIGDFKIVSDRRTSIRYTWDEVGILRESLAESFLKNNLHGFSSSFLRRKGINVYLEHDKWPRLDSFLNAWQLEGIGIDSEGLAKLKQVANLIAETNLSNISVFYDLERARSMAEFVSALQASSRKLVVRSEEFASGKMQVNPMSLDALLEFLVNNPTRWQIVRDTLLIYSSMYYAIKRRGMQ